MVNYVTPGYATAVFVSAWGVQRIRTTAESHRRIAIVEVMGRQSGWIALGAAYGQPDLVLVPEQPLDADALVERVREVYDRQQNVVIVCGEGLVDRAGCLLGARERSTDPAGNVLLSGAADALRQLLIERLGDAYFRQFRRLGAARDAIFTRKVGHTQRGGRPLIFDRFHAAQLGAKAVELLVDGANNVVATLQWDRAGGFRVDSIAAEQLRDRWGTIRPRLMHPDLFDAARMQPSPLGVEYLLPIFTTAIGADDVEHLRQTLFDSGNLFRPYHSVNVDVARRVQRLDE
jgi:6-phosphofructokinase 1